MATKRNTPDDENKPKSNYRNHLPEFDNRKLMEKNMRVDAQIEKEQARIWAKLQRAEA
jgi:hypothetical protein